MNMTIEAAIRWGTTQLRKADVDSPVLDAEVLLVHVVGQDRGWLYAHPEMLLRGSTVTQYKRLIARRARREPVAYIIGYKEFYGLDFLVNRHVLIPRPETEILVGEAAKQITRYTLHGTRYTIVDVGTGSGAIIVALAKLYFLSKRSASKGLRQAQGIKWFATDTSGAALRVARANARRHGVADRITFLRGDLFKPMLSNSHGRENLTTPFRFLITANLPYLLTSEWRAAQPEVRKWEPRAALDGGRDGLKYYRELFRQLHHFTSSRGRRPWRSREIASSAYGGLAMTVLCELCPHQFPAFKNLVARFFPSAKKLTIVKDIAGRRRVAVVRI